MSILSLLSNKPWDKFLKNNETLLLILILLFSIFLRLMYLDLDSMWIDETLSATAAKGILENGVNEKGAPLLESGGTYARSELFHYMMAVFVWFFGGDFGARFISVIFGVFTVYLAFIFGKRFIGTSFGGLSFAIFMAMSSLEIIYSKQARFYQAFQFFYFWSFYLFYKFAIVKERMLKFWVLDLLLLIFATFMTYHLQTMGIILIPLFIFFYFLHVFDFRSLKRILKEKTYLLLALIGIVSSVFIFYRLKNLLVLEDFTRAVYYSNLYSNFYVEILPFIAFSIIGLFFALKKDWRVHLSLFLFLAVPFTGLFFIKFFATRYVYFGVFLLFFYISFLFEKINYKFPILVFVLIFFSGTVFSYDGIKRPSLDFSMPHADYKGAYNYILQNEVEGPFVISWTPAAIWYGDIKEEYWLWYPVDGTPAHWMIEEGYEKFTNSIIIRNKNELPGNFTLVIDNHARTRIRPQFTSYFNEKCVLNYKSFNIQIFYCNQNYNLSGNNIEYSY